MSNFKNIKSDSCLNNRPRSNNNNDYRNNNRAYSQQQPYELRYFIDGTCSTAQFYVNRIDSYKTVFPEFRQPLEIGAIVSEKREENLKNKKQSTNSSEATASANASDKMSKTYGVKYLVLPESFPHCSFDLKLGFERFTYIDEHIPHADGIDSILRWIMNNKEKFQVPKSTNKNELKDGINTDFVCWRGLLTKLLATPYEKQNDWMFTVIYYKKTYYLGELETDKQIKERLDITDQQRQFTYWGHKFESYVTSDVFNGEPNGDELTDPEDNYSTVVRTRLGPHSLVYAGEVDCCVSQDHVSLDNYCEIKTSRGDSPLDLNFTRNLKFMKWWIQCFLIDTKKLLIGLRDDQGVVKKLAKIDTAKIYKEAQSWNGAVCFNFLQSLLDFIKIFCRDENCVYLFERNSASTIINCKKVFDSKYYFLRDWYKVEI